MMTHGELKAKALANPEVRSEYAALAPEFDLLRGMLQARSAVGMTQSDVADSKAVVLHCAHEFAGVAESLTPRAWSTLITVS